MNPQKRYITEEYDVICMTRDDLTYKVVNVGNGYFVLDENGKLMMADDRPRCWVSQELAINWAHAELARNSVTVKMTLDTIHAFVYTVHNTFDARIATIYKYKYPDAPLAWRIATRQGGNKELAYEEDISVEDLARKIAREYIYT